VLLYLCENDPAVAAEAIDIARKLKLAALVLARELDNILVMCGIDLELAAAETAISLAYQFLPYDPGPGIERRGIDHDRIIFSDGHAFVPRVRGQGVYLFIQTAGGRRERIEFIADAAAGVCLKGGKDVVPYDVASVYEFIIRAVVAPLDVVVAAVPFHLRPVNAKQGTDNIDGRAVNMKCTPWPYAAKSFEPGAAAETMDHGLGVVVLMVSGGDGPRTELAGDAANSREAKLPCGSFCGNIVSRGIAVYVNAFAPYRDISLTGEIPCESLVGVGFFGPEIMVDMCGKYVALNFTAFAEPAEDIEQCAGICPAAEGNRYGGGRIGQVFGDEFGYCCRDIVH
jgi:hypothetical protein